MKKVVVLVVGVAALLGLLALLRGREILGPAESPNRTSGAAAEPAVPGPDARPVSGSAAPKRSREELRLAARRKIHLEQLRWTFPWGRSRYLSAPLPKEPGFWALVAALKSDLGADAAAVLSDLIDEAVASRTEE